MTRYTFRVQLPGATEVNHIKDYVAASYQQACAMVMEDLIKVCQGVDRTPYDFDATLMSSSPAEDIH